MKGGTAINLFVRDMPRLSVDIDLTYLPIVGREQSLNHIDSGLKNIGERIRSLVSVYAALMTHLQWSMTGAHNVLHLNLPIASNDCGPIGAMQMAA